MLLGRYVLRGVGFALCCVFTVPASAQIAAGWYFRLDAGWSGGANANVYDVDADNRIDDASGLPAHFSDIGSGWLAGGGVGKEFLPNFRAEISYTYRGSNRLSETTAATTFRSGITSNSLMVNGYADIPLDYPGIVPFLGAGLGWSEVSMANLTAQAAAATAVSPREGTEDHLAWQIMAGVGFPVSETAKVDLFYRYFDAGHMRTDLGPAGSGGFAIGTYPGFQGALRAHEVILSVRFAL